ncbi:hypothetical protein CBR_g40184 [Chara braunii]|uniref:Glycerol kinase n=1 Tax=Chara braunii TaxID=69332 RepID=A0A388LT99_CHABU|nr:hypothetical protein CBR_g40184 [Chara braunii]|eukprot:GBG85546.1 hypothetical protein CBR_g40184 [Chara braunii]
MGRGIAEAGRSCGGATAGAGCGIRPSQKQNLCVAVASGRPEAPLENDEEAVLAIDVGTGGTKAAIITRTGRVKRTGFCAHTSTKSEPVGDSKTVEQDPEEWWDATCAAVRQCMSVEKGSSQSQSRPSWKIIAVAVTGQMQDVVLLPKDPSLRTPPSILYSDGRASLELEEVCVLGGGVEKIAALTGTKQGSWSFLAKLRWLDRHAPTAVHDCSRLLFAGHDFVVWRMSGKCVADATTASTTGLFLAESPGSVAFDLMKQVGLDQWISKLPDIVPADEPCGEVLKQVAEQWGNPELAGLPVFHSIGDVGASTIGSGAGVPGPLYICIGTAGWVAGSFRRQGRGHKSNSSNNTMPTTTMPTGTRSSNLQEPVANARGITGEGDAEEMDDKFEKEVMPESIPGVFTLAHVDPDLVLKLGAIMTGGGNFKWAISAIGHDIPGGMPVADADEIAAQSPAGSRGVIYLPYLNGERCPVDDVYARGAFLGLSLVADRSTMLRAVMEGVVFGLRAARDALFVMGEADADTKQPQCSLAPLRVVGGGARSRIWPKIIAGVFDRKVEVLADPQEVTIKGAAILAGKWLGWHDTLVPSGEWFAVEKFHSVSPEEVKLYDNIYSIFSSCYPALRGIMERMAKLRL